METLNSNSAHLCNYEVLKIVKTLKDSSNKKQKRESSLATVTYETLRYLQDTDCKTHNDAAIDQFMNALKPFKLTKLEKLMMVNTPPRTPLEIQLIIQESEERLTEEQVDELIKIVNDLLPNEKS